MSFVTSSFSMTINEDLHLLFHQATKHVSNRLKKNYEKVPEHVAYSIIYDDEDYMNPIGCSLLQERDIFNGMGRVLSRLYFPAPASTGLGHQNYKHSDGLRPEIYEMLDQQVELGRKLGMHDFFMSREDKTPRTMKKIHRGMLNKGYDWKFDYNTRYNVIGQHYQWVIHSGQNLLSPEDSSSQNTASQK